MEDLFLEPEPNDVRQMIANHLSKLRISQTLLSDELKVSPNHIKEILKCRRKLMPHHLEKINEILGTNFKDPQTSDNGQQP